jgi:hypothetical protein
MAVEHNLNRKKNKTTRGRQTLVLLASSLVIYNARFLLVQKKFWRSTFYYMGSQIGYANINAGPITANLSLLSFAKTYFSI